MKGYLLVRFDGAMPRDGKVRYSMHSAKCALTQFINNSLWQEMKKHYLEDEAWAVTTVYQRMRREKCTLDEANGYMTQYNGGVSSPRYPLVTERNLDDVDKVLETFREQWDIKEVEVV